jgi:integrase
MHHQLWKHPNGKWYVLYGPRLRSRVSTGETDRAKAEIYLSQFIAGRQEPTLDAPTVSEILSGYEKDHGPSLRAPGALKYGVRHLHHILGSLLPEHLTPTTIKRFAAERGASAGTILREVGILRAALSWGRSHNLISAKPDIPNPVPAPPPRERWLTRDEARGLLAACTEPHVRLFIMLGLMTAARSGAILDATWDQVDLKRQTLNYGAGHGNKKRSVVRLNPEMVTALQAAKHMACSNYVIEFRGKQVKTIKTGFAAACRRAGLAGVTPHILRHTAATWAVIDGRPLQEVAKLLGDSLATVERVYAKWSPEYLKDTVGALQLGPKPEKRLTPVRQPRSKPSSDGNES